LLKFACQDNEDRKFKNTTKVKGILLYKQSYTLTNLLEGS